VGKCMHVDDWSRRQLDPSLYGHEGKEGAWDGHTGICIVVVVFAFAF
jgi:hypothetical protein